MNELKMKAKAGVTLVELLVVILIVTILSVSLLPLLKPYIEQAKYAAEVQPTLANIQTKINMYHYEKDHLPCTDITTTDNQPKENEPKNLYTYCFDSASKGMAQVYSNAYALVSAPVNVLPCYGTLHLSDVIDISWQDLVGRRMNPTHFSYRVIKGLGAAKYGYVVGVFGDGDGLAKGTGFAVMVLVDTEAKQKVIATWERYSPEGTGTKVAFYESDNCSPEVKTDKCMIPSYKFFNANLAVNQWKICLENLKKSGWSFNFDDRN